MLLFRGQSLSTPRQGLESIITQITVFRTTQILALADQVGRAAKGTAERVEENVGSERDGPKMSQSGQGRVHISPRQVSNSGWKPR
jgi:hypothetical protein